MRTPNASRDGTILLAVGLFLIASDLCTLIFSLSCMPLLCLTCGLGFIVCAIGAYFKYHTTNIDTPSKDKSKKKSNYNNSFSGTSLIVCGTICTTVSTAAILQIYFLPSLTFNWHPLLFGAAYVTMLIGYFINTHKTSDFACKKPLGTNADHTLATKSDITHLFQYTPQWEAINKAIEDMHAQKENRQSQLLKRASSANSFR